MGFHSEWQSKILQYLEEHQLQVSTHFQNLWISKFRQRLKLDEIKRYQQLLPQIKCKEHTVLELKELLYDHHHSGMSRVGMSRFPTLPVVGPMF